MPGFGVSWFSISREWGGVMGRARYFTVKAGGQYLANSVIHNQALSFDALGLLLVMLAMHPAQPKTRDTLTGRGLGRRAVAVALHNLEAEGFRYRFKYAGVDGAWRSVCVLFDEPHDFASAFEVVQQLVDVPVACWRDAQDRPVPVDNSGVGDKTPGRTEVPVTDRRWAVPHIYLKIYIQINLKIYLLIQTELVA